MKNTVKKTIKNTLFLFLSLSFLTEINAQKATNSQLESWFAAGDYEAIRALKADGDTLLFWQGRVDLRAYHYDDALANFDKILAANDKYIDAHFYRAFTLTAINKQEEAAAALASALALSPKNEQPYWIDKIKDKWGPDYNRTLSRLHEDRLYEVIYSIAHEDEATFFWKGRVHLDMGQNAEALAYFDLALAKDAEFRGLQFYRAKALFALNKVEEATKAVDIALIADPKGALILCLRGDIYKQQKQENKALEFYLRAIDGDVGYCVETRKATSMLVSQRAVDILVAQGKYKEAIKIQQNFLNNVDRLFFVGAALTIEEYSFLHYQIAENQYIVGLYSAAVDNLNKRLAVQTRADYLAKAKLLRAYNALAEYPTAAALQAELLDAAAANKLPKEISLRYCLDEFNHKKQRVKVYQDFEKKAFGNQGNMLVKPYVFEILAADGEIIKTLSLVANEKKGVLSYAFILSDSQTKKQSFFEYSYTQVRSYKELSIVAKKIISGKVKPIQTM